MEDSKPPEDSAVRVLLEFLVRRKREARDSGDIEALCARHPALAADLRLLWTEWVDQDRSAMEDVASVMQRLAREAGREVDPRVSLTGNEAPDANQAPDGAARSERHARHTEIARGGMATIFRVRDPELRRDLAMKVALPRVQSDSQVLFPTPMSLPILLPAATPPMWLYLQAIVPSALAPNGQYFASNGLGIRLDAP